MRKCWLQAFSPFPTVFSKGLFCEQTLSSEEKILVTSIFSFSENAFKTFRVGSSVGSLKPRMANDKILDWSKMKAFADDKINVTQKLKFVNGRIGNIWEKEKMLVTSIFFFSQQCFQKATFLGC